MPLSEQEQRLLDEMERHLMNKDADVVSAPREGQTFSYRNIVYGTLLVLLGIGGLIFGVSSGLIVVGVIAFVIMVGGVVFAATPTRSPAARTSSTPVGGHGGGAKKSAGSSASFMDRMNDRWDRRQGDR